MLKTKGKPVEDLGRRVTWSGGSTPKGLGKGSTRNRKP